MRKVAFISSLIVLAGALAVEDASCALDAADGVVDELSLLVLAPSVSGGLGGLPSFASFIAGQRRTYKKGTPDYEMRRAIYARRLRKIQQHNSNPHRRWNAEVNHMTDRTDDELAELRGLRVFSRKGGSSGAGGGRGTSLGQTNNFVVAEEKLWSNLGAAKADTNQKSCGSCWAVAAATVLQANAEINGYERTFSPQELVSCAPNPHHCGGSGGCQGSTTELAMNWVMEHGLDTSPGTPYEGKDTICKKRAAALLSYSGDQEESLESMIAVGFHGPKAKSSPGLALGLVGWERLPENEYLPLIRAVAERGPVAVSVAADDWHMYGHGIFGDCSRDAVINHAVTLIGYGRDKDKDNEKFWLVKNSWGLHWGEEGNIRLLRQEGNVHCGTDSQPEVGTACDGGPSTVHVCGMCGILYDSVVPHFQKNI